MNKLIVGNWKMNPKSLTQALQIYKQISKIKKTNKVQVVACVPSVYLASILKIKKPSVLIGMQDAHYTPTGAETGQNSVAMVASYKPSFALVGHSEVRGRGDTDNDVNLKTLELLRHKIKPIICVGETDRDSNGEYLRHIKNQIETALLGVAKKDIKNVSIAYEPIWAIGTGAKREATHTECLEIAIYVRKILTDLFGVKNANEVAILYGGSVNARDAMDFIQNGGVDGLLIGRDSLISKDFIKIFNDVVASLKTKK
ncbi:MAG: triosephosphate isomerase [Candidatus Pacebacteria bacterium]|nr:triosephosphate isomerase [Candidatus Paceibacterota bacterium]